MDELELQLCDVVLFELPTFEDSQAFRIRLRERWPGWSLADGELWLFAADLCDASGDLPLLLHECQEILAERGLGPIRFVLDGRVYLLEPSEAVYEVTGKRETSPLSDSL
jgi:hypothetical protein